MFMVGHGPKNRPTKKIFFESLKFFDLSNRKKQKIFKVTTKKNYLILIRYTQVLLFWHFSFRRKKFFLLEWHEIW